MPRPGCLLLQTATEWKLVGIGSPAEDDRAILLDDEAAVADRLTEFVRVNKLSDNVVIGLHASHVLTGGIAVPRNQRRNRRMLTYELEQWLPWAAEDVVADFVADNPDRAANTEQLFGVAIHAEQYLTLVTEIERRGLRIQSISPSLLLALQSLEREADQGKHDIVIWQGEASCELIRVENGKLRRWRHLPSNDAALTSYLAIEVLDTARLPVRVLVANGSAELFEVIEGLGDVQLESVSTETIEEHARRASELVLAGKESPWIELRRNGLAAGDPIRAVRRELNWLAVAAGLLLAAISIASWSRTVQNRRQADQLLARQESLFRQAVPSSRIPAGIVSRLRSEHTKLTGAHGAGDKVVLPIPALSVLYKFLDAVPSDQQWQFSEIDIENGLLRVDAELPSHASANALAAALQRQGFQIDSPTTSQTDDGVVTAQIYGSWDPAGTSDSGGMR